MSPGEASDEQGDLDRPARDRSELVDLLEAYLLGEPPGLTGLQIAEEVGLDIDETRQRWRSLGFPAVGDDVVAFTHADLEALRRTQDLIGLGVVEGEDQQALVRSLGRSFAQLADWQMGLLARVVDPETMTLAQMQQLLDHVTPAVDALQSYVWRRHTLLAASRMLLAQERAEELARDPDGPVDGPVEGPVDEGAAEDVEGTLLGVGFADIVGFTRQSRSLSRRELARMVDGFEGRALELVTEHGGRLIKTIGDEVLFVADEPGALARIGLDLVAAREDDEDLPELRVGLAWGPALARLGDVLGPVVNIAARLTSTARPGTVLIDRALAEELDDDAEVSLRKLSRTSVRGYRKLEPWRLRWRERS